jgi:glycosyltransferase involved in cell wall biosynthesis
VPSPLEGFGLPVLEGMRRGVPVAYSNASTLPEVRGEAVRYSIHATSTRSRPPHGHAGHPALAEDLVSKGLARAKTFHTWERTAEGTLESYERAVAERRR